MSWCKALGTGLSTLSLTACLLLASCHGDKRVVPYDRSDSAVQEVFNAHVRRSERGRLQLELDAPIIQKYDLPKPRTVYRAKGKDRVLLCFFDDEHRIKSSIEAGYAVSLDDRNIMEASDSVVVIDYGTGDTIYLVDLVWNSAEDRIYSDNPVRAKNGSRITEGDGFVSDQRMDNMHIIRQRGVIEFQD